MTKPENSKFEQEFHEFKNEFADIIPENIMLARADLLSLKGMRKNKSEEFNFKIDFYNRFLRNF